MSVNLPQIKRKEFFIKFKNWFKSLFCIGKKTEEAIEKIDKEEGKIKKDIFKETIQAESKDKILALQRRMKEKQIKIVDLTDEELDEMIELYKKQINEKENKLKQYRQKNLIKSKKEEEI